jgi:hypothetical protein
MTSLKLIDGETYSAAMPHRRHRRAGHGGCHMGRTINPEQQMTKLLTHLQLLVRGPTLSFRLDEMRTIVAELMTCWGLYRRRDGAGDARSLGLPTTRDLVDFPYSRAEQRALFTVAHKEDVEHGGRCDAWGAAVTFWTRPWPHPWTEPVLEDSAPKGTLYFAWGRPSGLWQIETHERFTLADLLGELGRIELKAFGHFKHGDMPAEERSAPR